MSRITAIVGAQFGSEGKGVVVHRYAVENHFDFHVRTGGPNAGHSFIHRGRPFVVQSVPVGFVDISSALVLGAGAVINPRVLRREIEHLESCGYSIRDRLYIDHNATVLTEEHEHAEGHTGGEIHVRIGSTGEGVGTARAARVARSITDRLLVSQREEDFDGLGYIDDTAKTLNAPGRSILLEGTQGSGLSLTHGPWPYCTSADTNAAQLCADAGISPLAITEVILVARTMPIRVAGNSGPLYQETSWRELSAKLGRDVEERTTVTKKVRRLGHWDDDLFDRAVMLNRPTSVALTFLDYLNPEDYGVTEWNKLSATSFAFIMTIEQQFNVTVNLGGTGVDPQEGWTCVQK